MSTTNTTSTPAPTCAPYYQIPTQDAACAVNLQPGYSNAFDKCCKPASVVTYNNGCNIYCLAEDQPIEKLQLCLQKSGTQGNAFCNAVGNATATATNTGTATGMTTGTATGEATGTSAGTPTSTETPAKSTHTGAAIVNQPVSKSGLALLAMTVFSGLLGVLA